MEWIINLTVVYWVPYDSKYYDNSEKTIIKIEECVEEKKIQRENNLLMIIRDFNARIEFVEVQNDIINMIPKYKIDKITNGNG